MAVVTNIELLALAVSELENQEVVEAFENGLLLTFNEWKKRGYSVQKGEKAKLQTTLWKMVKRKPKEVEGEEVKEEKGKFFIKKKCSFFTPSQVKEIYNIGDIDSSIDEHVYETAI